MTTMTTMTTNANTESSIPTRKSTNAVTFTSSTKMRRSSTTTTSTPRNLLSSSNNHNNNNGNSLLSSTHYLHDDDVDMEYCKEISRRAVARAALHLGVEEMSGDALCVLGDVLVSYLERIGKVMSSTVEASSRSSAHCNVFDALHAVEACTPIVASQLYLHKPIVDEDSDTNRIIGSNNDGGRSNLNNGGGGLGSPWEGLASFLFGDDWCNQREGHPPLRLTNGNVDAISNTNSSTNSNGGGNSIPVAGVANDGSPSLSNLDSGQVNGNGCGGGWNVPHYDSIESFPQRNFRTGSRRRIFFHDLGKEEEACRSGMMTGTTNAGVADGVDTKPGVLSEGAGSKQPCFGGETKNDSKDICEENSSKSLFAATKSKAEGAERNAEWQANGIPEWNYQNGITSFWGSVATVPLSRCGITGGVKSGVEGSGNSGGMDIDAMTGSGKDTGGGGGGKEDTVVVASGKRKNDGSTKTAGGSQQQEKRAKTTGSSGDGGKEDSQFNNNASGSDTMLQKISKRGTRPIYIPPFLPPFPPEHTYNPSSSIVLLITSGSQSSSANMHDGTPSGSGVAELLTAATESVTSTLDGNRMHDERGTKSVRESLITLGRSVGTTFWGSTNAGGGNTQGIVPSIQVQTSIPGGANQGRNQNKLVTPLERASTLKVSRLLEGSLS